MNYRYICMTNGEDVESMESNSETLATDPSVEEKEK